LGTVLLKLNKDSNTLNEKLGKSKKFYWLQNDDTLLTNSRPSSVMAIHELPPLIFLPFLKEILLTKALGMAIKTNSFYPYINFGMRH